MTYSTSDPQSGLSQVDVLLGNTVVASRDLTTRCRYVDFTVCPASDDATLLVDTRKVMNGSHTLTLRVRDAAGNETLKRATTSIEVANPVVPQLPVAGGSSDAHLTATFEGASRSSSLTVPYGRRVTLRGRLTNTFHAVDGARIEVRERTARNGSKERVVGGVQTALDGTYSYRLRRYGP